MTHKWIIAARNMLARFVSAFRKNKPEVAKPKRKPNLRLVTDDGSAGYRNAVDIHDVLDTLPEYFDDLRALRALDQDSYRFFSIIGAQIPTKGTLWQHREISPDFIANPPTTRAIFLSSAERESADGETIWGRIFYLIKLAPGRMFVTAQGSVLTPRDGTTYRLTAIWRPLNGHPLGQECFINVEGGQARILPERAKVEQAIVEKRKGRRYGRAVRVFHDKVAIPQWTQDCARRSNEPIENLAQSLISMMASATRPKDVILVRAEKDGLVASWTIDRRDGKRFFRKRDKDGETRKRILHYVAPFDRTVDGQEQHVREHFRGNRHFDWMGYAISISGIGFHHDDFMDADINHYDETDAPAGAMMSMKRVAKLIRRRYDKPVFLTPKRRNAA